MSDAPKPVTPCPQLSPYVEATLAELRADGIQPTDAEIGWLIKLRERCDRTRVDDVPPGWPITVAGVTFWPRHRLATTWWLAAHRALDGRPHLQVMAFIYAHTQSRPGDVSLRDMAGDPAAILAAWGDALPISDAALPALCERLRAMDGNGDAVPALKQRDDEPAAGEAAFLAGMAKLFPGTPVDYWRSGISEREATELAAAATSRGDWADSAERGAAITNYMRAVAWIRARHHGQCD